MFQSGIWKSKNPIKYFYNTRSLPKNCRKDMQANRNFNSISISSQKDTNSECSVPQRCYSSVKVSNPTKRPSFSSIYSTKSRYQNIMELKPKKSSQKSRTMSFTLESDQFESQDKQNRNKQQTRLDRIMSINVVKPNVTSTLKNYEPPRKQKVHPIKKMRKEENCQSEWRQCKKRIARMQKQEEKEDMLWKSFERERQKRYVQSKIQQERCMRKEREREVRFQKMVQKQLKRIQSENEVKKRESKAFSPYLYPLY